MRRTVLVLLLLALAGCGSAPTPPPVSGSPREREWAAEARNLLSGLDGALPRIANAGVGPTTLTDTSHLYSAVLGYTYVDSCGDQLDHLGAPSRREEKASTLLHEACAHLHHASTLFTRAVQENRASLLVAAAGEALGVAPLLQRVRAELKPIT
jgi:hypothetical protein